MNEHRLRILLSQYFNNSINREDCEELLRYIDEEDDPHVSRLIDEHFEGGFEIKPFKKSQKDLVFSRLMADMQKQNDVKSEPSTKSISFRVRDWYQIAAVLVLACSIGFLIYKKSGTDPLEDRMRSKVENDIILPNSNSALLTLA